MPQATGLLESLKRLAGTSLAIVQTRLELLSNELEEERLRIRQLLFYGSVALFLFGMATLLLTVFIVVLFWDSYRLQVLGGLTVLFFFAGLLAWNALLRAKRERPRLFSASLAELADDIERLTPRP
ncbi:MAG: phage holin family protein [Sideroxyarcus sp.]|nr:phage holin family protein [Sideroxyarcus sp.]